MANSIVILFPSKESPLEEKLYKDSYLRLLQFAKAKGIDLRFVIGKENYQNGIFQQYWVLKNGKLARIQKRFTANLVLLHIRNHGLKLKAAVNSPFIEKVCTDKYLTFKMYRKFSKTTILVTPKAFVNDLKTDLIVIKPRFGANGYKVKIIKKTDFIPENFKDEKYIAQEFIESAGGIDGLINRRHELRLFVFNGLIKAAYLRVPKKDSYLSNISKGATALQIDIQKIPKTAIELKSYVDKKFAKVLPRTYSIDIMFEKGEPWIVELNDIPGMPDVKIQPLTDIYLKSMLELFESYL